MMDSPPLPVLALGRRRVANVFILFGLLFTVVAGRLVQIQLWEHDRYRSLAIGAHSQRMPVPARRGRILDRNEDALAINLPVHRLAADCTRLATAKARAPFAGSTIGDAPTTLAPDQVRAAREIAEQVAAIFAEILQLDIDEKRETTQALVAGILADPPKTGTRAGRRGKPYLVLKRQVEARQADLLRAKLEEAGVRGVIFEPDVSRSYPNDELLSHVIGYTDQDGVGKQGIERTMERHLKGESGYRQTERDRFGRELAEYRALEQPARDGDDVVLTVDIRLQAIVEAELEEAYQRLQPAMATAVMLNPCTGEVLAMASRPTFDPNDPGESETAAQQNRAILHMVEPGSTFKIVTVAGALNEGKVRPDDVLFCENGRWEYEGKLLRDSHPSGNLSVREILVQSSNIGAAKLGIQLGRAQLSQYIRAFGFGDITGIELPAEARGQFAPWESWNKLSISRLPMGHEINVTALQMAAAMGVIANGGEYVAPRVVRSIRDAQSGRDVLTTGRVVARRVIDAKTAANVRDALEGVVLGGTAKEAKVPGFRVAGKTGTAQKAQGGTYLQGRYVASFAGFMPAQDPRFVCIVLFDNAQVRAEEGFGGKLAAPVFARIAARAAEHLQMEPDPALLPPPAKPANLSAKARGAKPSPRPARDAPPLKPPAPLASAARSE